MTQLTRNCRPVKTIYYHGTTDRFEMELLLPPSISGVISERGRKKNLDKVFFTKDFKLAAIYAGRAARSIGGNPVVYRVVQPVNIQVFSTSPGVTIFMADWAFLTLNH